MHPPKRANSDWDGALIVELYTSIRMEPSGMAGC